MNGWHTRQISTRNQSLLWSGQFVAGLAAVGVLTVSAAAAAQVPINTTTTTTNTSTVASATAPPLARLIEWDLPAQADSTPGAVVVDTRGDDKNRLFFVTRGVNPTLYRMEFPKSLTKGSARWTSWALNAILAGGLKKVRASHDRRFLFVRTITSDLGEAIERVDTQKCGSGSCERTVWTDENLGLDVSDVALDDYNNVFTAHTPFQDPTLSYIQRLTPGSGSSATITRWNVSGSGAGWCGYNDTVAGDSVNVPCVAGISVHPSKNNLVYYSEPSLNAIAELNIGVNPPALRRWSLTDLTSAILAACPGCTTPIFGPRQLIVDGKAKVWVVTGSGHLVSLNASTSQMTSHEMPLNANADPFGLAPDDDVVGYTSSKNNRVGMLLPKGKSYYVASNPGSATKLDPITVTGTVEGSICSSGWVGPIGKTVDAIITSKADGTFIEAQIDTGTDDNGKPSDSKNPLGITPVKAKAQGTFFYTVGNNLATPGVDRVGFARLPIRGKIKYPRDDDDANDGWQGNHKWHDWHGHDGHDDDDDGFEDAQDSPTAHEDVQRGDSTPVGGGQSVSYPITASATTLALIAKAEAEDPLAQIGIDILDARGLLVATAVPTPGVALAQVLLPAAGNYTARVRNYGLLPVNQVPTLIVREPPDLFDPLVP